MNSLLSVPFLTYNYLLLMNREYVVERHKALKGLPESLKIREPSIDLHLFVHPNKMNFIYQIAMKRGFLKNRK